MSKDISYYLSLSDDELVLALSNWSTDLPFASSQPTDEERHEIGRRNFKERLNELREDVCGNPAIRSIRNSDEHDAKILLGVVIAIVIQTGIFHLDGEKLTEEITIFCILMIRNGLNRICNDD